MAGEQGSPGRPVGDPVHEPVRYQGVSAAARRILQTQGESGRFEFKADSHAANANVLVAAANWVALSVSDDPVTVLVGVEEVTDPSTGLTTGRPVGLRGNDLSVHVRRIQDYAASTRPVPVEVRIVEEGVNTKTPFLRIEVRPTFPPHFDGAGRRVTRNGASTRALEDEVLLAFYLDRETRQFEARFQSIARDTVDSIAKLQAGLIDMAGTLDRLPTLIDGAEAAAYATGYEIEDTRRSVSDLEERLAALEVGLSRQFNRSPENVYLRLRHVRRRVWRCFNVDRLLRPSKTADRLAPRLLRHLNDPIDFDAYITNRTQLRHWESALERRERPAAMRWWLGNLRESEGLLARPAQADLVDDRNEIRDRWSTAKKWSDLEGNAWPVNLL